MQKFAARKHSDKEHSPRRGDRHVAKNGDHREGECKHRGYHGRHAEILLGDRFPQLKHCEDGCQRDQESDDAHASQATGTC